MAMEKHFIHEGVIRSEIENLLKKELNRAGYSSINIQKTPLATRIILYVEKPPIVIGKKGRRINTLTQILREKYNIENPEIDVQKIDDPILDPNIVARRIAVALERGMNRRRVTYKALRAVMSAGALGIEIILAGKIVGKGGRARTEKYAQGYMRKAGDSVKFVRKGATQAYLKAGVIGVKVHIVPPDTKFPDQIRVLKASEVQKKAEEKQALEPVEKPKKPKNAKKKEEPKKEAPTENAAEQSANV